MAFLNSGDRDSLGPFLGLALRAPSLRSGVQIGCPADLSNPVGSIPIRQTKNKKPSRGRLFIFLAGGEG
jgi:hypothetical protein